MSKAIPRVPLSIDTEMVTRYEFKLECMDEILIVELDRRDGWIFINNDPEPERINSTHYCWTFKLDDKIWKKVSKLMVKYRVLSWIPKYYDIEETVDDLPKWEMIVETETIGAKWKGYGGYPEQFWDYKKALWAMCDGLYLDIYPDLNKVNGIYVSTSDDEYQLSWLSISTDKIGLDDHNGYREYEPRQGDCEAIRSILLKYPLCPQSQKHINTNRNKKKVITEAIVSIEDQGQLVYRWDENGPEWAKDMLSEISALVKRIISEPRPEKKWVNSHEKCSNPSLSQQSASLIRKILPITGARFPLVENKDYHKISILLDNVLWRMSRCVSIGVEVDEELRNKLIVASREWGSFDDMYVDVNSLNMLLF